MLNQHQITENQEVERGASPNQGAGNLEGNGIQGKEQENAQYALKREEYSNLAILRVLMRYRLKYPSYYVTYENLTQFRIHQLIKSVLQRDPKAYSYSIYKIKSQLRLLKKEYKEHNIFTACMHKLYKAGEHDLIHQMKLQASKPNAYTDALDEAIIVHKENQRYERFRMLSQGEDTQDLE